MSAKAITNKTKNVVLRSFIDLSLKIPNRSSTIICTSKIGNLSEQVGLPLGVRSG